MELLAPTVDRIVKRYFSQFVSALAERFKLPKGALIEILKDTHRKGLLVIPPKPPKDTGAIIPHNPSKMNPDLLRKLKVDRLKEMCKIRGLKMTGKKDDLIARLLGKLVDGMGRKKPTAKKVIHCDHRVKGLLERLSSKEDLAIASCGFRRNLAGLYVSEGESLPGIVFSEKLQKVIGHLAKGSDAKDSGKVEPLTKEEISKCREINLPYLLPENLNLGIIDDKQLANEMELTADDFKEEESEEEEVESEPEDFHSF